MNSNYYEEKEEINQLRKNIISWYPFKKDSKILEINTGIEQLHDKGMFDYVIINGIEERENELQEYLVFAKNHINPNGTILFTVDNKFGIQNTKTNPKYQEKHQQKHFMSKKQIEEILKKCEFNNYKFYYPLPNYKIANIIFTDKRLPNYTTIHRDLTLYDENDIITFDERRVYKNIIKEDVELFKLFANSYLVEISNEDNNIELICYGNLRKEKYRIQTVISDEYVYKKNVYKSGKEHLETIKNNIDILNKLKINTLDTYDKDKIISKLVKEIPTFDKVLIELFEKQEYNKFDELIERFFVNINEKLKMKQGECKYTVFEKYKINIESNLKNKLHYTQYGLYDLIFQNCFYIDNEFFFFDQEWKEDNIPVEFILYRAIFYLANSKSEIERQKLYERFNLTEYLQVFEKLENILQEQIKDEQLWTIHALNNTTVTDVYNKKVHYRNLKTKAEQDLEKVRQEIEQVQYEIEKVQQEIEQSQQEKEYKQKEIEKVEQSKVIMIKEKDEQIAELTQKINYMKNSKSWKLTRFLRVIRSKINVKRKGIQNDNEKKN